MLKICILKRGFGRLKGKLKQVVAHQKYIVNKSFIVI